MSDTILNHPTLLEQDKKQLHPLHHPKKHRDPLIIERGQGVWLHTTDGRKFMDAMSGLANVNIGYGNQELGEVARDQMNRVAYSSNFVGLSNPPSIALAHKLAGFAHPNLNTTFFTSGGSEANETAFKTARYYWKRRGRPDKVKFISRWSAYHGNSMATTTATGIEAYWHMFGPPVPGFVHIPAPNPYCYEGDIREGESVGQAAARALEEAILHEGPETVAAFIAEPVQSTGGVIVPPDDYFPRVREICDQYDILLIADEVITGFGRTGQWFGLWHWDVQPDIMSFAKGVTSGYLPLGGIQISDEIKDVIMSASEGEAWMHCYTYSGHATVCAVACKNLEIIERDGLVENAHQMGSRLRNGLETLTKFPTVDNVRGLGLLCGVEIVKDKETREPDEAMAVEMMNGCAERDLRIRALGNTLAIQPPFIINEEEVDKIVETIGIVLKTISG